MSYIQAILQSVICKDQTPQLEIKDNEIQRLKEDLKDARSKHIYGVIIMVFMFFWALGATLAAIEIGMHN